MLFQTLTSLLASLALAGARDTGKFMKTVPTISNSLVNLGKMEISVYFNGKHADIPPKHDHSFEYYPQSQSLTTEPACPCNNFKPSGPSFLSDPTEIINKILKSNDLFKDPTSSLCCGSHEQMQDSTVFFEMSSNNAPGLNAPRNVNSIFPTNSNVARSSGAYPPFFLPNSGSGKSKTVEILLFPRRKDMATFELNNFPIPKLPKRDSLFKPDIQPVGSKDLSFNSMTEPSASASVKKDLTLLEKKNKEIEEQHELQTDSPPVTNVNNTL